MNAWSKEELLTISDATICSNLHLGHNASVNHDFQAQPSGNGATVELQRAGSQPSTKGPEDYFTGTVRIDPLFSATDSSRISAGIVTFEPCARSAWHTHPLGQRLVITAGFGRVQSWGGPIHELRPGDVVIAAPGEKHWHGAAPTTAMTHIAIQETLDGKNVDWLEKVTDVQYHSQSSD